VCLNDAHGGVNSVGKEPARKKEAHRYYCRFFLKQYRKRLVKLYGRNYLGVEKW
jgi:hypothetical protein